MHPPKLGAAMQLREHFTGIQKTLRRRQMRICAKTSRDKPNLSKSFADSEAQTAPAMPRLFQNQDTDNCSTEHLHRNRP
jgi:hypothetical protein